MNQELVAPQIVTTVVLLLTVVAYGVQTCCLDRFTLRQIKLQFRWFCAAWVVYALCMFVWVYSIITKG